MQQMKLNLEIKGGELVISLTGTSLLYGPDEGDVQPVESEITSASLSLETIRQAMNTSARSRYKAEPMK
jgi:hypothetical protein